MKILFASLLLMCSTTVLAESIGTADQVRKDYIRRLVLNDCGACHGMTFRGGLGPPLTPESLMNKPDQTLIKTILNGRPGTPMPPWAEFLTEEDVKCIVSWLKNGRLQ